MCEDKGGYEPGERREWLLAGKGGRLSTVQRAPEVAERRERERENEEEEKNKKK